MFAYLQLRLWPNSINDNEKLNTLKRIDANSVHSSHTAFYLRPCPCALVAGVVWLRKSFRINKGILFVREMCSEMLLCVPCQREPNTFNWISMRESVHYSPSLAIVPIVAYSISFVERVTKCLEMSLVNIMAQVPIHATSPNAQNINSFEYRGANILRLTHRNTLHIHQRHSSGTLNIILRCNVEQRDVWMEKWQWLKTLVTCAVCTSNSRLIERCYRSFFREKHKFQNCLHFMETMFVWQKFCACCGYCACDVRDCCAAKAYCIRSTHVREQWSRGRLN